MKRIMMLTILAASLAGCATQASRCTDAYNQIGDAREKVSTLPDNQLKTDLSKSLDDATVQLNLKCNSAQ